MPKGEVQRNLRLMKESWYNKKAEEIQSYADNKNAKIVFQFNQSFLWSSAKWLILIFSADGNKLLTDKEDILVRWLAPTLFNIKFTAMLKDAFRTKSIGVGI
ncbi:craniofacial development protein 2 [Biomphalaria glabrata]|nr:craniofacial development protein 2 [Biomphalaria glabrata]